MILVLRIILYYASLFLLSSRLISDLYYVVWNVLSDCFIQIVFSDEIIHGRKDYHVHVTS